MNRKRLAVARFWYEGNAFSPAPADVEAFSKYEWLSGPDALDAMRGTATELGAVARFADEHPEWEVVVLRCAAALPAGPIDEEVLTRFTSDVLDGLKKGKEQGWDAIYLSLHGAAITTKRETPELDFVREVRALLPDVPLGASFDIHGNMPPQWAQVLDFASVYRTHPHIDMDEVADRVINGLVRCATEGLSTRIVLLNEYEVLPSINMRTAAGPMHELEACARAATTGSVLEVSVFGGFPYSDTAWTASSVLVVSDAAQDPDGHQASTAARLVMDRVHELAPQFRMQLIKPEQAVAEALAISEPGLLAVTDSGDNPMSGGAGDTPGLMRALVDARPQVSCLFASFADAGIAQAAHAAGRGAVLDVTLGGRYGDHFGHGVTVRARVERVTDGEFVNAGPMQAGVPRSCGLSAVLSLEDQPNIRVIVTERVAAADDPEFYALHGIELDKLRLLCVKAKNHFRAAFAERCMRIIDCDAPGPACYDLSQLPYRNRRIQDGY